MNTVINAKELRSGLPQVVRKVRRGMRFTVSTGAVRLFNWFRLTWRSMRRAKWQKIRYIAPSRWADRLTDVPRRITIPCFTSDEAAVR